MRSGQKVVGLLLVVMLVVGSLVVGPVPVARGLTSGYMIKGNISVYDTGLLMAWLVIYSDLDIRSATSGSVSSSLGSEPYTDTGMSGSLYWVRFGYQMVGVAGTLPISGSFSWNITTAFGTGVGSDTRTYNPGMGGGSLWLVGDGDAGPMFEGWGGLPLSVSIAGPSSVVAGVGGDWSASASGGTAPYTYGWAYGAIGPFFTYPYAGSTLAHDFAVGSWVIGVRVTDSLGATAFDDLEVESSTDVVGYRVELARSGTYGQYITAIVYDGAGVVSPIAHTVGTECGLFDVNGSFGWYANAAEASWINLYWRWTLTVVVGGAASPPPAGFWFRTSIHLTNGTELAVSQSFTSLAGIGTVFNDDAGDPINPDVPPEPESVLPVWLQELFDSLKIVLQWLFVPKEEQIKMLMPSGSLGASLLEGTSWGSGAGTWNLHVHWGESEITLVSMNFTTIAGYGFVTAIRLATQAVICLGLVYMVVVLL